MSQLKGADNIMLTLIGRNGNLENVILAVAICPSEDEDNCTWFMQCCISAGISISSQPVFSDRGSGIIAAANSCSISLHFCTRHILGNRKAKLKCQVTASIESWLWDVQNASSALEFESKVNAFVNGFPDITDYIRKIDPAQWALYPHVHSTKLYGWRTTNFVESENAKSLHARARNPALFLYLMEKWMKGKYDRYTQAKKWVASGKRVTPEARKIMDEQAESARFHEVSLSNDDVGFVRDMRGSPTRRRVNLREKSCACSFFFQNGIPCAYISSMLAFMKQPERVFDFSDSCYLVDTYMQANNASTSNIKLVIDDQIETSDEVQPPQAKSKRGRPKTKRIPIQCGSGHGGAGKTKW